LMRNTNRWLDALLTSMLPMIFSKCMVNEFQFDIHLAGTSIRTSQLQELG
jgi:hypothetical protein